MQNITTKYFFCFFLSYFLINFTVATLFFVFSVDSVFILLINVISAFVLFTIFKQARAYLLTQLVPMVKPLRGSLLIITALISLSLLNYLYNYVLNWNSVMSIEEQLNTETVQFRNETTIQILFNILFIGFLAPVIEELLFRGFLFSYLNRSGKVLFASLLTSALFGLMHSGLFFFAFTMSIMSIMLYKYTKSLRASIYFHIAWNSLSVLLNYLQ